MTVGIFFYIVVCVNIYGPQIFIGNTCNHFCLFNICYKNKNVYAYITLCRLNTSSGGSRRGLPKKCS